jgi:hypothetical protein
VKHWWEGEYGAVTESDYDHLLALALHYDSAVSGKIMIWSAKSESLDDTVTPYSVIFSRISHPKTLHDPTDILN